MTYFIIDECGANVKLFPLQQFYYITLLLNIAYNFIIEVMALSYIYNSMVHKLVKKQTLPASLDEVWDFFSSAGNLSVITPPEMNFRVTSGNLPKEIYPGQIITYKVSPILNIPLFWMTEITHVVPQKLFVDEQRAGPYKIWHHEHHFEATNEGVLMTDIVHYQLPFWFLGDIANSLFVKQQLQGIFDFRTQKTDVVFGKR